MNLQAATLSGSSQKETTFCTTPSLWSPGRGGSRCGADTSPRSPAVVKERGPRTAGSFRGFAVEDGGRRALEGDMGL